MGIEPSESLVQLGRQAYGLDETQLVCGNLESYSNEIPAGSVDLVVAWHVIEHVPNPTAFSKLLVQMLAPEGVLLLQVPALSSQALHPLHHCFFSSKTVTYLARECGLSIQYLGWDPASAFITAVLQRDATQVPYAEPLTAAPLLETLESLSQLVAHLSAEIVVERRMRVDAESYCCDLISDREQLRRREFRNGCTCGVKRGK
jgi:SAM-dependent methyltransferase